ncbi:hypothetical protein A0H81_13012 [Grifola frondosa]|uniref:Aquaporin-like protein n=1 Tax=Grifola frondosa TaxID=5627 RepID=A0A1C7LQG0_GRIFR|nr:hypothetical protein A0H81_13012 [Grifola frondosa]
MFTSSGPAGIFALYANPGAHLGFVFVNEFVCDFILALLVVGAIEPSNHFSPPVAMPWIIGLAYATMLWSFSPTSLSSNTARDLGGRFAALTLWGKPAFGGSYAAIAALVNIPATFCAVVFYELIFYDSARVVSREYMEFGYALKAERDRKNGVEPVSMNETSSSDDKISGKV